MLGGGAALLTGLRMDRTRKLERLLDKIAGDRDNIPLDELFAAAGIDAAKGRTVVESAISHGYFGADAYIDNRTNTLVVRGAAPQPPRKPKPAPAPEPAPADQYTAILQQLRQVNDAIPDPVMTIKISRLEAVSARIFELAKQDPAKRLSCRNSWTTICHRPQAAEHLRQPSCAGCAGGKHRRCQKEHRAQHGPAGDRL